MLKSINIRFAFLLVASLFLFQQTFAHASIVDIEKMGTGETLLLYTQLGFEHILPLGLDHILFILSLFIVNPKLKPVLLQATAFTVAHTMALALSMYKVINPPPAIVEPLIALSIAYVAIANIFSKKLSKARIGVVFLFGLVHGMGFAGVLSELGLPQQSFLSSLLMFNVGVELGQITVILLAYFLVAKWFGRKAWYQKRIVIPVSVFISLTALYWVVERVWS